MQDPQGQLPLRNVRYGGKLTLTLDFHMAQSSAMRRCPSGLVLGAMAGSVALQGCQPPAMHVRTKSLSPDHQKIAYVLEENSLPLVSTASVVLVKPVNRKLDDKADLVFRGGDMSGRHFGPINVRWLKDDALWVGYCSGRTSLFRNYWSDVHADDPTEIEVVLEKEAPGQWPRSGPPNGKSGPPPCP